MFRFATGKLTRSYDESLQAANELQRSESGAPPLLPLPPLLLLLLLLLLQAPRQSAHCVASLLVPSKYGISLPCCCCCRKVPPMVFPPP